MSGARRLGLTSAAVLVVANTIGAGVFTTSGFALADLGSPGLVLLAWAVGGAVAMLGAISYGALAARLPESGGEYLFLSRTLHPLVGFVAGWISLLAGFTAPIAVAAVGLQAYVLPGSRVPWLASAAIVAAGLLHGVRLAPGVRVQNAAVAVKLVLIAAFLALGAARLPASAPAAAAGGAGFSLPVFAVSLMWISFSYSGWNAAVYIGGEVRDPARNLPRSLALGTLLVIAVYLALNAVFVYSAPYEELAGRKEVAAVAAEALGGEAVRHAASALIALALFTSVSAMVMAGPRVYARMAADGRLPRALAGGGETPVRAIALQVVLSLLAVWVAGLRDLLLYAGYTLSLSTALTVIGLLVLRAREGQALRVPGHPWLPGAFVVLTLGIGVLMMLREPWQALAGLATALSAVPVYLLTAARRESRPA